MGELYYLKEMVRFAKLNGLGTLWVTPKIGSTRLQIGTNYPVVDGLRKHDVPMMVSCFVSPDLIYDHPVLAHDWVEDLKVEDLKAKEYRLTSKTLNMKLGEALEAGYLNIEYVGK